MKYLYLSVLLVCSQLTFGQQMKDIGGKITDQKGVPVSGATIIEKSNPTNGVVTDFDGQFIIAVNEYY